MPVIDGDRSVTSAARRAQLVDAAIGVIADVGYAKASYARIATAAGLSSTRFLSYHFDDKADLMTAVVQRVVEQIGRSVGERVAAQTTAAGMLRAYLEAVVEFIDRQRASMIALTEIGLGSGFESGINADRAATADLERILRHGQASGEFRDFDPAVMAMVVQRSVDGLPFALQADPDLDCAHYAREVVTIVELATTRR